MECNVSESGMSCTYTYTYSKALGLQNQRCTGVHRLTYSSSVQIAATMCNKLLEAALLLAVYPQH